MVHTHLISAAVTISSLLVYCFPSEPLSLMVRPVILENTNHSLQPLNVQPFLSLGTAYFPFTIIASLLPCFLLTSPFLLLVPLLLLLLFLFLFISCFSFFCSSSMCFSRRYKRGKGTRLISFHTSQGTHHLLYCRCLACRVRAAGVGGRTGTPRERERRERRGREGFGG